MAGDARPSLNSWKEIAEYLGRDVTTAIRWEKERGLPVRRVPGARRSTVFAYAEEIDAWLLGTPRLDGEPAPVRLAMDAAEVPPSPFPSPLGDLGNGNETRPGRAVPVGAIRAPRRLRIPLVAAAIVVLAAGSLVFVRTVRPHRPEAAQVARLSFGMHDVIAWGARGEPRWSHELGGQIETERSDEEGYPRWAVSDPVGGSASEVLASIEYKDGASPKAELLCFSESGDLLWRRWLKDDLVFRSGRFGPPWQTGSVATYSVGKEPRIAWVQNHWEWWPSILEVLDARGTVLSRFIHAGQIWSLLTLDSASRPLILGGGISNVNGAAMMIVLDGAHASGSWPETRDSPYACVDCPPGRPLKYFVFPPSEVVVAQGGPYNHVEHLLRIGGTIDVWTREGVSPGSTSEAIFTFSEALTLQQATYSDGYPPLHDRLWREGKLDHSWERCAHRVPRVRLWEADHGWTDVAPAH